MSYRSESLLCYSWPKSYNLNNIFTQDSLNAIVFKLQVILLIMEGIEKSESSYDSLSYWDRQPSYSHVVAIEKVAE